MYNMPIIRIYKTFFRFSRSCFYIFAHKSCVDPVYIYASERGTESHPAPQLRIYVAQCVCVGFTPNYIREDDAVYIRFMYILYILYMLHITQIICNVASFIKYDNTHIHTWVCFIYTNLYTCILWKYIFHTKGICPPKANICANSKLNYFLMV